jgi:negative regulator of genetic competence, sporulation and motility
VNTTKEKEELFKKLKQKGIFWSFSKDMKLDKKSESTFIEHTLKYGDFDDIVKLIKLYKKEVVKANWLKNMAFDKRFIKVNLMIARVFFDMDVESDYFKKENPYARKFKLPVA